MTAEERCNFIEECYEFMLAYAAQGRPADEGSPVRAVLHVAVNALTGLADNYAAWLQELDPGDRYEAFLGVLDRDAHDSLAAIQIVRAQPVISSQLIDNLNASIHLRAILTDLLLIGEIVNTQRAMWERPRSRHK